MPPVEPDLVERIRRDKARRQSQVPAHCDRPTLAFVLHSFNRVSNIDHLIAGLRYRGDHELIVCEDGSLDGSHEKWMSHLDRPNDFLIHSNDIHEIRVTDRAIRFTNAEIICLVQDDDRIPPDTAWLDAAQARFRHFPNLAIIGGFMGFPHLDHLLADPPDPNMPKRLWGPAPFQFVHYTNSGPYFVRKAHYEMLGGWDYAFSAAGELGIGFECELCLRAWVSGYEVGYSFVPFRGHPASIRSTAEPCCSPARPGARTNCATRGSFSTCIRGRPTTSTGSSGPPTHRLASPPARRKVRRHTPVAMTVERRKRWPCRSVPIPALSTPPTAGRRSTLFFSAETTPVC